MKLIFPILSLLFIFSCEMGKEESVTFAFQSIPTPCKEGGEPNLFVTKSGDVYLSWVEFLNDTTDALMFSKLENGQWGKATEIARGNDWFVNWADFPSLILYENDGASLAAHWLQKSTFGTYDYDVHVSQSVDGGKNWGPPFILHRDSIAAEHGFVTLMPISEERIFATWLDGRNTKASTQSSVGGSESGHGHGHGGAMTLRAAEFDRDGNLYEEAELDGRICDCCQTDAALTANGPIVVYRNRSDSEMRDIGIVRKVNGKWTAPKIVHADNWEITGCPVNGPAVAAKGDFVAVTWFTAASGGGEIKVAFSKDAGNSFSAPFRIDDGDPTGRVDLEIVEGETVLVTWLENTGEEAEIHAAKVSPTGKHGESISLVSTSPARSSGFPVLAKMGKHFMLAWTAVDSSTTVNTAILK